MFLCIFLENNCFSKIIRQTDKQGKQRLTNKLSQKFKVSLQREKDRIAS